MRAKENGYTLFEVLFTLSLSSILLSMGVYNLNKLNRNLKTGVSQVQGFLKQTRTKAVATTSAYVVSAESNSKLVTSYKSSCESQTSTPDDKLNLELPVTIELQDPSWSVCFNARGLADESVSIVLVNSEGDTSEVEVLMGGAVREVE